MEPKVASLRFIAQELGFSHGAVRKWVRQGKLKAYKIGNRYVATREELERFLKERETK